MTQDKTKKGRPKGTRPEPNEKADKAAVDSLGGELPEDDSKKRHPKGEKPVPNPKAEEKAKEKEKTHGEPVYFVAEGHSVRCRRGKLKAGDPVLPKYFAAGVDTIIVLQQQGLIVKK